MKQHDLEGDSPLLQRLLLHCLRDYNKIAEGIRLEESLRYHKNDFQFPEKESKFLK